MILRRLGIYDIYDRGKLVDRGRWGDGVRDTLGWTEKESIPVLLTVTYSLEIPSRRGAESAGDTELWE